MKKKIFEIYEWIAARIDIIVFLFLIGLMLLSFASCSHKPVQQIEKIEMRYIDSLVYTVKDTTVLKYLDVERYVNIVRATDTSRLETKYAQSTAFADSLGIHHTLENKSVDPLVIKVPVESKERIVYRDSAVYVDRPVYVDVVKYEIPLGAKRFIVFSAFLMFGMLVYLLIKVEKRWGILKRLIGVIR